MTDKLEQLLRKTDAVTPAPAPVAGLADAVVRRNVARRNRRHVGIVLALIAVVGGVAMFANPRSTVQIAKHDPQTRDGIKKIEPAMTADAVRVARAQLAELAIDAKLYEQTADLLERHLSRPAAAMAVAPNPHQAQDRAALLLVYEADRDVKENRPTQAVASYRRAIDLFPQSHWADVARERLKELS